MCGGGGAGAAQDFRPFVYSTDRRFPASLRQFMAVVTGTESASSL